MKQIDILIETIKELHQNTVFIERDYVYDQKKVSLDGYSLNTDEFFEKLKYTLEDRIEPKLEWEQNAPSDPMTWDEATQYAESLNTMSDYGWRLPTKEELKDAYDNNLEGFPSSYYWSSGTYPQDTDFAWFVSFSNGYVYHYFKTSYYYVRCVRDI